MEITFDQRKTEYDAARKDYLSKISDANFKIQSILNEYFASPIERLYIINYVARLLIGDMISEKDPDLWFRP